jgi:hypothetical protein
VSNSLDFFTYGAPDKENLAIEAGCISIEDHLDCQSNHKYLEGSDFIDTKKGISKKVEFKEFQTENKELKLSL